MVKILKSKTYNNLLKNITDLKLEILQLKEENNKLNEELKENKFNLQEEITMRENREKELSNYFKDREADYD